MSVNILFTQIKHKSMGHVSLEVNKCKKPANTCKVLCYEEEGKMICKYIFTNTGLLVFQSRKE